MTPSLPSEAFPLRGGLTTFITAHCSYRFTRKPSRCSSSVYLRDLYFSEERLEPREVTQLAQSHTAGNRQKHSLVPRLVVLRGKGRTRDSKADLALAGKQEELPLDSSSTRRPSVPYFTMPPSTRAPLRTPCMSCIGPALGAEWGWLCETRVPLMENHCA